MKLEIFTTIKKTMLGKATRLSLCSALLLLFTIGQASAQCPLGCNNNVQISLDGDCSVEVTPDMVLEGQGGDNCDYQVVVLGSNGQPIVGSPVITGAYIGETLKVEIWLGSNSCWGYITIEDKLPPTIDCLDDITVNCYESTDVPAPTATDNCDNTVVAEVVSDETVDLDCSEEFSARRTIIYQATDVSGNESAFCTRTIFLERITLADVVFPMNRDDVELASLPCGSQTGTPAWDTNANGYPDVTETGTPETTDGFNIFPNNSYCELNVTFSDQRLDICESSFKVLRRWTVLDWCTGDIEEDYQIIKVLDNQPPIITCTPDIVEDGGGIDADPYSCTADWPAIPPTVVFDCSSTTYTVAYLLGDGSITPPESFIYIDDNVVSDGNGGYIIEDLPLGRTWIRYTVTDACGNVTNCFTEVDVVDNVPPVPVCDEFTVATLTTNGFARIFAETFDDGSHDNCSDVTFEVRRMSSTCPNRTTTFGEYVDFCCADIGNQVMVELRVTDEAGNTNSCMVEVSVQDKLKPVIDCPANITVDCATDIEDFSIVGEATGSDNCGNVTITHTDSGTLTCGTGTITRTWRATDAGGLFETCTQRIFVVDQSPFNGNSIQWPQDRNLMGCMEADTDPSSTGTPSYSGDLCSQLADTYEDQVFTFVDDACFKILRTWTVIDWCQFDQNNPSAGGIWQRTQVIKVNNDIAPVFNSCSNLTVDAFGENCNEFVELVQGATDECTPEEELEYTYELDVDNDGTIDFFGSTNDASRTLDVGVHSITWVVEDRCGNATTCTQTINVRDRKKPTPYCLSEVTTVIMPSTGMIDIWASDFDLGSFDNCPGDIRLSFSSSVNNTSVTFDCDQVGLQILELWVTDAAGNQDFCTTQINIQANEGCDGSRIAGSVAAENNAAVEEVTVVLQNMGSNETLEFTTQQTGSYQFINIDQGADYEVTAERNDNHRNGVNTLDIVKIQRHILQLEELETPYQLIAADATNDGRVKASDLLEIRKLVLGVKSEFTSNNSWRFVDAKQGFADPKDPFPFAEAISVSQFTESDMDNDFMAVKIGDVDMSADTDGLQGNGGIESRSGKALTLGMDNVSFTNGELVQLPITAANAAQVIGLQFTLEAQGLQYESITAAAMAVSDDNVAAIDGDITVSWNDVVAQDYDADEVLFVLNYRARTNGTTQDAIEISSSLTDAEAYDAELNTVDVDVVFRGEAVASEVVAFELKQNAPNPFADQTTISFMLPEAGQATLRVFDITGKVVAAYGGTYSKGANELILDGTELQTTGVMYYQLEYAGQVATKKMISIAK